MSEREGCFLQTMNCGCVVVIAFVIFTFVMIAIAMGQ